jgi:hypothetical protein
MFVRSSRAKYEARKVQEPFMHAVKEAGHQAAIAEAKEDKK